MKVRLPVEICEALDKVVGIKKMGEIISRTYSGKWGDPEVLVLNDLRYLDVEMDDFIRALINGYQPILTPEEKIKEIYFMPYNMGNRTPWEAYKEGLEDACLIHGIRYDWMVITNERKSEVAERRC